MDEENGFGNVGFPLSATPTAQKSAIPQALSAGSGSQQGIFDMGGRRAPCLPARAAAPCLKGNLANDGGDGANPQPYTSGPGPWRPTCTILSYNKRQNRPSEGASSRRHGFTLFFLSQLHGLPGPDGLLCDAAKVFQRAGAGDGVGVVTSMHRRRIGIANASPFCWPDRSKAAAVVPSAPKHLSLCSTIGHRLPSRLPPAPLSCERGLELLG